MAAGVLGLASFIVFSLIILAVGIWVSWRKKSYKSNDSNLVILAGRSIGTLLGALSITATWVGGDHLCGLAEVVHTSGLAWALTLWGAPLNLIIGGLLFAGPMRKARYVTMLDPYKDKYGNVMAGLMYIPSLLGELFWSAALFSVLGATASLILDIPYVISILVTCVVVVLYTVCGGLYSVIFTDVVQILFVFGGLWLGVAFALAHPAVYNIGSTALGADGWVGKLETNLYFAQWIDYALLIVIGGMPWQSYFQRVLAASSPRSAQVASVVGAAGTLVLGVPAVLFGAIGRSTDWNKTEDSYGSIRWSAGDYRLSLPRILLYLTPLPVAVVGLGAISAAVMSSLDSSLLSCSSMFAHNVYRPIRDLAARKAGDREIIWVLRITVIVLGVIAALIALTASTVFGFHMLAADLIYAVSFPQIVCVLHYKYANAFGAAAGYLVSIFFRLSSGDALLQIPPLIEYPMYDAEQVQQQFPVRTLAMLLGLVTILLVSFLFHVLVNKNVITNSWVVTVVNCYPASREEDTRCGNTISEESKI